MSVHVAFRYRFEVSADEGDEAQAREAHALLEKHLERFALDLGAELEERGLATLRVEAGR